MRRAAGYVRVSREEQAEGFSPDAQEREIRRYASSHDIEIAHIYTDLGRSGKNDARPEFQALIRDAESGVVDTIIVQKLDRFSRSVLHTYQYLEKLDARNVSFVSVSEQFDIATPGGRMMLGFLAIFAQWYLDNLSQETIKGKRERARQGHWNGVLPFGYTTLGRIQARLMEESNPRVVALLEAALDAWQGRVHETAAIPCPINNPGAMLIFELYATGLQSYVQVAQALNQAGYRTTGNRGARLFSKGTVRKILLNPFYIGQVRYREELMPGAHEPLISRDLFDRCQEVVKARRHAANTSPSRNTYAYPLSGLLYCVECGQKLTGHFQHGKRRYRGRGQELGHECGQRPNSMRADSLEETAARILRNIQLPDDWRARILENVERNTQVEDTTVALRQALERQLERAQNLYLWEDITEAEYLTTKADIESRLPQSPSEPPPMVSMERAAQLLADFPLLIDKLPLEKRGPLFQQLFEALYVGNGQIVGVKPALVLHELMRHGKIEGTEDFVVPEIFTHTSPPGSLDAHQVNWKVTWVAPELSFNMARKLIMENVA